MSGIINAKLKNKIVLSSKVTVYVPATVAVDQAVDNTEQVKRVASALSGWFGGATSTPALGYWLSPVSGLVAEKTTVVFAYTSQEDLEEHCEELVDLCEALKIEMQQEAIALEINGDMAFI